MEPKVGTIVGSKFRLEKPLARGGMGSVWSGRHVALDLPVAVKFMSTDSSAIARTRFEREAKAAAQLPSPHIVKIVDYGVDDEVPYIVMELLAGEDLRTRLQREGRLTLRNVASVVGQLAKGLKLAHDAGIIHRDLKP